MTTKDSVVNEFNRYPSAVKLKIRDDTFQAILKRDMFIDTECHSINVNHKFEKTVLELIQKHYGKEFGIMFNNTHSIFWVVQK